MKFAICNETFQDWSHDKAFAMAAECGYTGIEIAPFTLAASAVEVTPAQRTEIRSLAKKNALEVVGLHWLLAKTQGLHVTSPDAAVRNRTSAYLADLIRLCADLGGKVLVFGSPLQRNLAAGMTLRQGFDHATQVLEPLLPLLEQTGAVLALEPLGPQEGNFLMTGGETTVLIERLASPHVQLHLDCKAMATESLPIPDLIRRHCDVLAHFHVNDPNRQGPGFGSLDFHPILQTLGEVSYRGWVSVEVFDYTPGVERLARESIAYMQRCLADLAQDS